MQLAPGPIPPISGSWYDQSIEDPGLVSHVVGALASLDALEPQMDITLAPSAVLDDALPDSGELAGLDELDQNLPSWSNALSQWDDPTIDSIADAGSRAIGDVYSELPAEAWQPLPPEQIFEAGQPLQVGGISPQVSLSNLTNPGATGFLVGDQYQFSIAGFLNENKQGLLVTAPLWAQFTKDGTDQPQFRVGTSDATGAFTYSGTWGPGDTGSWSGYFLTLDQGQVTNQTPNVDWVVVALGTPASVASALYAKLLSKRPQGSTPVPLTPPVASPALSVTPAAPSMPTFVSTTPSGLAAPVQVPDYATYLDVYVAGATDTLVRNIGTLQDKLDFVTSAGATYRALYPLVPADAAVLAAALQRVRDFYASVPPAAAEPVQPTPAAAPSVELMNTTSPGDRNFLVGESWALTVRGQPNSEVVISGAKDGQALTPAVLGQTNAAGEFRLSGTMSAAEVGDWSESYAVGGANVGSLNFGVR
jgi:hypothetical protein